ncbi:MAG TPA: O-antigen ligase family protein [Gaiellaceae bacterium]|nr:O-antigen ligase family protein [Gaiellaceae bacterium]
MAASRRFSLLCAAGALIAASLLFGGGSGDGAVAWIGGAALVVAVGACALAFLGLLPLPGLGREGIAFAVLGGGFVAWTGLTVLWSALPDRSWDYFNRGLGYFAFAVVGAFAGSALSTRAGAWLLGALVGVTCLWALAGKAVPALYEDYGRLARLRSPVGYWNALALVMVFGLPIALWAASSRRHSRVVRAAAVVGLYALLIALVLTYSRGGLLTALVALALWFALTRERFESLAAIVAGGVPAALVSGVALLLPGIADDGQSHSVRVHDGSSFGLVFLLGAGGAFAAAYFLHYRPGAERERLLLRVAAGLAIVCVAAAIVAVSARGNPLGATTAVGSGPSRLGESSLNNRWGWWKEAWHGFAGEPLGGTGAGSFEVVHRKFRESAVDVRETHNLPLQFASESGIVGLALWAGAMAAGLVGAWRALGRLAGDEREAALALGIALPAFLVHGLLDYDWDFVALAGPVLFVIGFLLATGRDPVRVGRQYAWVALVGLVAWAGLYSIAAPRVAAARVDDAYSQIERGSLAKAVSEAKSAHSLNPLSIDPLEAWASAEEARGNLTRARELYAQAVDLQPLNWRSWYELGLYDREVLGHLAVARRELRRALELDPHNCQLLNSLGMPCTG